ncbi:MAG: hypothetical protein U5N56_03440 [Candidatus Marinimicrobia bacterium]|nr:hypothetical protein [Candidatus Neomarinimicrobiota bacterium]
MKELHTEKHELIKQLFRENEGLKKIFDKASAPTALRKHLLDYFSGIEWDYFHVPSLEFPDSLHIIEKNIAKECIRVLKNILQTENETLCEFSALKTLFNLYHADKKTIAETDKGFILEFLYLFRAYPEDHSCIINKTSLPKISMLKIPGESLTGSQKRCPLTLPHSVRAPIWNVLAPKKNKKKRSLIIFLQRKRTGKITTGILSTSLRIKKHFRSL